MNEVVVVVVVVGWGGGCPELVAGVLLLLLCVCVHVPGLVWLFSFAGVCEGGGVCGCVCCCCVCVGGRGGGVGGLLRWPPASFFVSSLGSSSAVSEWEGSMLRESECVSGRECGQGGHLGAPTWKDNSKRHRLTTQ